ncbi:MAG TPA: helix-turn-helix transcriptional regulator [Pseudolabrys sp.]|nr:helix-turn-helix transcriptional regulator [Pseudolabrys sp.]
MKARKLKTVKGSGNVFRDLGRENTEAQQLKALLAAEIVRALDDRDLTVRKAESLTRIAAADFSRIRNANLDRFTVDRLMVILARLGRDVDVAITVRQRKRTTNHRIHAVV